MNGTINESVEQPTRPRTLWRFVWTTLCCAALVAAGLLAYRDSFGGPFIFDDGDFVSLVCVRKDLIPRILAGTRPIVDLTFVFNYWRGGLDVDGYHKMNLAIHLLAALALFGVARRTLELPAVARRFGDRDSTPVAFCIALLWTVHPLLTQSVTYLTQRAESLMGLFFLLTLYCFIRAACARRPGAWSVGAVAACALGMGCKQVMAAAPLVALLYDRCFIAGSFREALRRRWGLYLALAATWFLLARSLLMAFERYPITAGFALPDISPVRYARNETGVILHYLRLAFWPSGLCLDYGWPITVSLWPTVPSCIVMALLLAATLWALIRKPMWGFLGAWFFLILAPTSSFMPIRDLAFEQRMYLPLAAVVALAVVAAHLLSERLAARLFASQAWRRPVRIAAAIALMLPLTCALGWRTYARNLDYQDAISIWTAATKVSPLNPRAWSNLGQMCFYAGRYEETKKDCAEAIRLNPDFADAYNNLGLAYAAMNQLDEALHYYDEALRLNANDADAYINRGNAYDALGRSRDALRDYGRAVAVNPNDVLIYLNRAITYYRLKEYAKALADIEKLRDLGGIVPEQLLADINRAAGRSPQRGTEGK
ncbi:MAG: tetratricopeptide repeat protein [Candidatus Brocadiia bacterium]|jgi:tetratricopeptide (TPR) repeat protein